jgi:acetyl esterase/lipase
MAAYTIISIVYAQYDERELDMDLYLPPEPSGGSLPVVMVIPVGGWRSCQKREDVPWLVDYGFAVAVIECRVVPEVIAPATIHDCKAGVRWLRAHGAEYGLDADRIGTFGSSAGGHLSALMAVSAGVAELEGDGGNADVSSAVQASYDQCGPTDLERMADADLAAASPVLEEVTYNFLGGPVGERRDLARLMSPLTYVSPGGPPILIVHGEDDPTVPVAESVVFHEALIAAGVDATLHRLPGQGHSLPQDLTAPIVAEFFQRVL